MVARGSITIERPKGESLDIDGWLRGVGLEQYAQTFHDNAIDLGVLPDLVDSDLEKMGILVGVIAKAVARHHRA